MRALPVLRTVAVCSGVAAAAGIAGYALLARRLAPEFPDIALHAGLDLLSRRWRALAIGAHPDDLEFFIGGTLSLLSENHTEVTMAVLSCGGRGGRVANIGEIRAKEQAASAAVLGAQLRQFDLRDGALASDDALRPTLAELWRELEPDLVFACDPRGPVAGLRNPDHVALGQAVLDVARLAVTGARLYLYGSPRPNVLVDTTEVIQEKVSALKCHRSQLRAPDRLISPVVRRVGRLARSRTPAMYTETLYRLI
ncbi:MAG TPA: PIG-L deacetylase family protein [Limnochordia bacterium]|nr:PIG-L deacetylase family protein [Limnochordia bacterium]